MLDDHARYLIGATFVGRFTVQAAWKAVDTAITEHGLPRQLISDTGLQFTSRRGWEPVFFPERLAALNICLAPGLMEVLDHPERLRIMPAMKKYPPELKERAVRLLLAAREDAGGARGASTRIGQQLGIPADTLRKWLQRAEIDSGVRPGTTTEDATRLLELERENRELRRANAILRSASAFFAAEPGRPSTR